MKHAPLLIATAFVFSASLAQAQCPNPGPEQGPIQNYTGAGTITCPCFVPNEEAGAVFSTIPASAFPILITKVGIGWGSQNGGQPPSVEDSIDIYGAGLPNPGPELYSLPAPQMTDGYINEFDVESYNCVLTQQTFTVTLRFYNQNNNNPSLPSVVEDGNGCQSGKNVVKVVSGLPPGWYNSCSLGVSGDWLFYVKYKSCGGSGSTGTAFCFGDGTGNSCPCDPGQAGQLGQGCANSSGSGAQLSATGSAQVSSDTLVLHAIGMPNPTTCLFFQGLVQQNGGMGAPNQDGLLCVNGSLIRLGAHAASPGSADFGYGIGSDPLISVKGLLPGAGGTRYYQAWYRDNTSFCTASTSNFSNGLAITWAP